MTVQLKSYIFIYFINFNLNSHILLVATTHIATVLDLTENLLKVIMKISNHSKLMDKHELPVHKEETYVIDRIEFTSSNN